MSINEIIRNINEFFRQFGALVTAGLDYPLNWEGIFWTAVCIILAMSAIAALVDFSKKVWASFSRLSRRK